MESLAAWMRALIEIIVSGLLIYIICLVFYLRRRLSRTKEDGSLLRPHERYKGRHVYAVDDETRWRVPRQILVSYLNIKDPRITEIDDRDVDPVTVREFAAWNVGFAFLSVIAGIMKSAGADASPPSPARPKPRRRASAASSR